MKITTTEQAGKDGLNKLVELTKGKELKQKTQKEIKKETQQEKNKRIEEEVLKGVFE